MPNQHVHDPVSFRPTPDNRVWLKQKQDAGVSAGSVINRAVAMLRIQEDAQDITSDPDGR